LTPKPSILQKWSAHQPCHNITFEMQKNNKKKDTITQMASGDVKLCPVQAAAAIICKIRSYPGTNNNNPIFTTGRYDRIKHITSKQIRNALRDAILAIGKDSLHIAADKIGTHSIHSRVAMAMLLGGCPVFLIMIIGCWSSNTFLHYILKQVKEFNHDVSQKCSPTL
jgi:hypothetical protein